MHKMEIEAYHLDEYIDDMLASADELAGPREPFHLAGTSIGSCIAWGLASGHPERVHTLACINTPHSGALADAASASQANADDQRERFSYFRESRKEGNERVMFEDVHQPILQAEPDKLTDLLTAHFSEHVP